MKMIHQILIYIHNTWLKFNNKFVIERFRNVCEVTKSNFQQNYLTIHFSYTYLPTLEAVVGRPTPPTKYRNKRNF